MISGKGAYLLPVLSSSLLNDRLYGCRAILLKVNRLLIPVTGIAIMAVRVIKSEAGTA
jgi:hypothetical protein